MSVSQHQSPGMQPIEVPLPGRVFRVPIDRQMEALERLVSATGDTGREAARRFRDYARQNRIDLSAMWAVADAHNRIERSLLAVPSPGRTAMLFITRPTRAADIEPSATLIDAAAADMGDFDISLAQVLVDPRDHREQQAYVSGGFTKLAELSYLERSIPARSQSHRPNWPENVTVEPCADPDSAEWASTLEQSYIDTLDCPGLLGLRRIEDVIEGHKSVGVFDASLWTLMRVDGKPAGVLMMNPTPTNRSIELVYLGLVPFARGRGLATLLLQHGLAQVAGRDERVLTLAVDDQNTPALRLYRRAGFQSMLRRMVYIRSIIKPNT